MYDADSQPITIQSTSSHPALPKRSSSVVANALAVPGALKDFLYPSASTSKSTIRSDTSIKEDSSSSGDEEQSLGWLHGKRKSGMKLVYGLLGGNTIAGSPSTAFEDDEDDDEDEDEEDEIAQPHTDEAEVLDERTMSNFKKYFVLAESEKLLTGKKKKMASGDRWKSKQKR